MAGGLIFQIDSSSIIDMEEMEVDESDYETNISDTSPSGMWYISKNVGEFSSH